MAIDLELAPKQKRPAGEPCCEPVVYPDVEREHARVHGPLAQGGQQGEQVALRPAHARDLVQVQDLHRESARR